MKEEKGIRNKSVDSKKEEVMKETIHQKKSLDCCPECGCEIDRDKEANPDGYCNCMVWTYLADEVDFSGARANK